MAKCCVCGEPVVNGRCIRCGMICREDDGTRYHLNENARDHEQHSPGTRRFSVYSDLSAAKSRDAKTQTSPKPVHGGSGSSIRKSAGGSNLHGGARQGAAGTAANRNTDWGARNRYAKSRAGESGTFQGKLRIVLVAAVILFSLFEALFSVSDDLENVFRKEDHVEVLVGDEEIAGDDTFDGGQVLELADDEVYWWTEKEMPSTGDHAEFTLEAGCYFGGCQIPVGIYTVEAGEDCSMSCCVEDEEETIYVGFWISDTPDESYGEYSRVENVRIYPGTQISFLGTGSVHLVSGNAQSADLAEPTANPNTTVYSFEIPCDGIDAEYDEEGNVILPENRILTAGIDFEPGTYDVCALSGTLYINADYNGGEYESLDLDASGEAFQCAARMKNITFGAGDKIYLLYLEPEEGEETVSFELRPSEEIFEGLFQETELL